MAKHRTARQAAAMIPNNAVIMCGGFLGCGSAHRLIEALVEENRTGLTIICNDAGLLTGPDGEDNYGLAKLIYHHRVSRLITSHIGLNPEAAKQMHDGELKIDLLPQGSLAEMIRAGGYGLGGVLTRTGLGTLVEQESEHVAGRHTVDGVEYLLMKPLRADYALICGQKIDAAGNIWYAGTARNFNPVMAEAADVVIAEAEQIVEVGAIAPENVHTHHILVDYIVSGGFENG